MNPNKKVDAFDYYMFKEENERYLKYLYNLIPKDIRTERIDYERFCKFCYMCS